MSEAPSNNLLALVSRERIRGEGDARGFYLHPFPLPVATVAGEGSQTSIARSPRCKSPALGVCLGLVAMLILFSTPNVLALEKIRLAVPAVVVMYAPLDLGIKQGFFAQEGLEVEVLSMRTDLAIAALGTGEIDFIAHGGAALRAAAQGFPLKLVFALDHKAPFWLIAQPAIQNVQMLKGKKVGVSFPGDTPQLVLKRYLRRQGIDPDRDVSYVGGQFSPTGMQSLLSRALDAAVLAPPFNVLAVENGLRSLVFLGAAVPDATTANGIVTSDAKIKQKPDQVQRMVRASLRSLLFYREKKEVAVNFLASDFVLSRSVAEKVYKDSLDILTPQGEISRERVRNILGLIEETKLQKSLTLQPDAILDFSFLRKAHADLSR